MEWITIKRIKQSWFWLQFYWYVHFSIDLCPRFSHFGFYIRNLIIAPSSSTPSSHYHHERVDKLEINANLHANTLKQKNTLKQITSNYYWIHILCGDFFMRTFFPTEIFSLCVVNFMIPLKIEREFECNVTRLIALPFTSSNRLKVLIDCHWAAFNSNENWLHFECDRMCGLVML